MSVKKRPEDVFNSTDFSVTQNQRKEFEACEFTNCIFNDLSQLIFRDCMFINCNLSNMRLVQTMMQNCTFTGCKLLGLNFSGVKDFGFEVHFDNCLLDYSSFDKKKMNKSSFKNCKMHSSNFTQADLSKSSLTNCDLYDTLFSGTNLSGVDFTSSINFVIDPELNKVKKAKFLLNSLPGLLQRYEIIVENS